jgi:glycosyltransferase involved in cell wall biosynthesis
MSQGKKYNFLFVSAPFSGVEVFMKNVNNFANDNYQLDSNWIWLERNLAFSGLGWSTRGLVNWTVKAGLYTHLKIRELERTGKKFDAAFFNHITPITLLLNFRKRVPTVLSLDATPILMDEYLGIYQPGHKRDLPKSLRRLRYFLTKKVYHDAKYILAWSNIVKKSLVEDYNVPENKIAIVPPGVDLQQWNMEEKKSSLSARRFKVLFVGAEFVRKGGDLLLELARQERFKQFEFHFVSRTFSGEKTDNVFVYEDVVPNSDRLMALYRDADILALPTRGDFCPTNTICEAMATGLPVISTNVGGLDEIVKHGETGYIIRVNDKDSLSKALLTLADDGALRTRLGHNARKGIEDKYNLKQNIGTIFSYLRLAADNQEKTARNGAGND